MPVQNIFFMLFCGMDSREDVVRLLNESNIDYPVFLLDTNAVMANVTSVPTFIFLDKNQAVINSITSVVETADELNILMNLQQ